ncbi:hypothetical protein BZA70DRAFT_130536 [Myxozyma melibiosi]|uniref:Uncharacterized protein n=1 Tax=Myxozyma melibiosi TaxID=54550 RepID=A0ABR1F961_9ASCO
MQSRSTPPTRPPPPRSSTFKIHHDDHPKPPRQTLIKPYRDDPDEDDSNKENIPPATFYTSPHDVLQPDVLQSWRQTPGDEGRMKAAVGSGRRAMIEKRVPLKELYMSSPETPGNAFLEYTIPSDSLIDSPSGSIPTDSPSIDRRHQHQHQQQQPPVLRPRQFRRKPVNTTSTNYITLSDATGTAHTVDLDAPISSLKMKKHQSSSAAEKPAGKAAVYRDSENDILAPSKMAMQSSGKALPFSLRQQTNSIAHESSALPQLSSMALRRKQAAAAKKQKSGILLLR